LSHAQRNDLRSTKKRVKALASLVRCLAGPHRIAPHERLLVSLSKRAAAFTPFFATGHVRDDHQVPR